MNRYKNKGTINLREKPGRASLCVCPSAREQGVSGSGRTQGDALPGAQGVTVNVTTCASILSVQSVELAQEIETEPDPALPAKANE